MATTRRPVEGQISLFGELATPKRGRPAPEPIEWPGGVKPWDPIDAADTELGWQHRFVTPARAVEIRREINRSPYLSTTSATRLEIPREIEHG